MGMMVMPSVEVELLLLLFFFALPSMLVHHVQLGFLSRHRFAPCCSFAYNHPVLHVGKTPDHSKVSVFSPKEHPPCSWGLTAEQCLGCLLLVEAWLAQVSQLALGRAYWPCSIVESGTLIGSMLVQGVHVVSPMINRRCGKLEDLCYTELGGRWRHVRAVGFVKT